MPNKLTCLYNNNINFYIYYVLIININNKFYNKNSIILK